MKIEPQGESTDPLITIFNTQISELLVIVEAYRQRKLAEDIEAIEREGGILAFEDKLKTSVKLRILSQIFMHIEQQKIL